MNGYYNTGQIGENGHLSIEVTNIGEFKRLILQAKREADQLQDTINQLENFHLDIEFSTKTAT